MSNAALYTPTNPPSNQYSLAGLNPLGSAYGNNYGQPTTDLIIEDLRPVIFDSAPQQFYDLRILNMVAPKMTNSDEFNWLEKGYGRDPVVSTALVVGGGSQITITVTAASLGVVSVNTLVGFPNGTKGTVQSLNTATNQMTINMLTGTIAPTVNVNDIINNISSVEADGANTVYQDFRIQTIKRYNFIQNFAKGMMFGERELEKYKRSGVTDFLEKNRTECMRQFRIDISNVYWNGVLGQVQLSDGNVAKTSDGVWSMMQKAGSPIATTTIANVGSALEAIALNTEYGNYGDMKFAYCTPTMCRNICKYYKDQLVRYDVTGADKMGSTTAPLMLDAIDIGSTRIHLVPIQRFQDTASFPASWQNMIFLLDQKNIEPAYFMAEYMITTPDRRSGINLNTFTNFVMSADFSLYFNNPLACGAIIAN